MSSLEARRARPDDDRPTSLGMLVTAAAVSLFISAFVPFGGVILYPFTLLATWVHEMGHGLAALSLGGGFQSLEIFADASGFAHTTMRPGVEDALVSLGGLVAPSIAGAIVFAAGRGPRRAHLILVGLAVALTASLVIWVRSFTGFVAVPLLATIVGAFAWWGSPRERMFLVQLIGLRLAADTLTRGMDYLFSDSVVIEGAERASDAARVAAGLGGPRILYSVLIAAACLCVLAVGVLVAWWKPAPRRRGTSPT